MKEVFDNWRQFVESAKEKPLQEQTLPTLPGEEGPPSANEPVVLRPPKYRKDRRKSIDRPKTVTKYIENLYNATIKPLEDWYLSLEDLDERIAVDILDPIGFTDIPDLKEAYAEYCAEKKWNTMSDMAVSKKLPDLMLSLFQVNHSNSIQSMDGTNQKGYRRVRLKRIEQADLPFSENE